MAKDISMFGGYLIFLHIILHQFWSGDENSWNGIYLDNALFLIYIIPYGIIIIIFLTFNIWEIEKTKRSSNPNPHDDIEANKTKSTTQQRGKRIIGDSILTVFCWIIVIFNLAFLITAMVQIGRLFLGKIEDHHFSEITDGKSIDIFFYIIAGTNVGQWLLSICFWNTCCSPWTFLFAIRNALSYFILSPLYISLFPIYSVLRIDDFSFDMKKGLGFEPSDKSLLSGFRDRKICCTIFFLLWNVIITFFFVLITTDQKIRNHFIYIVVLLLCCYYIVRFLQFFRFQVCMKIQSKRKNIPMSNENLANDEKRKSLWRTKRIAHRLTGKLNFLSSLKFWCRARYY